MRALLAAILISIASNSLIATGAEAQSIPVGTWEGQGFQKNRSGPVVSWSIRLRTLQNGNGIIEYPSLNCIGTLTRLPTTVIAQYREHIDHGMCADNGVIEIQEDHGKLIYHWAGEGITSQMTAVGELPVLRLNARSCAAFSFLHAPGRMSGKGRLQRQSAAWRSKNNRNRSFATNILGRTGCISDLCLSLAALCC